MTDSMTLEIERLDDLYNMFSGDEKDITVAVGQLNTTNDEMISVTMLVSLRANIEEGDTLILYSENMGTALIPLDSLKDGSRKEKEQYALMKPKYDELLAGVKERKNKITMTLEGKGFNVIRGVWLA